MTSFIEARHAGLGATDGAAAIGLNPYKTPVQVWQEKIDPVKNDIKINSAMHHGTVCEPGLIMDLSNLLQPFGYEQIKLPTYDDDFTKAKPRVHSLYKFLYFHPDAIFKKDGKEYVVEIKTARNATAWNLEAGVDRLKFNYQKFENYAYATIEDLPPHYYWQVQHQLMINDSEEGVLYAEIGGYFNFRIFKIKRDPKINQYRRQLIRFWRHHVEKKIEPAPVNADDVKRLRDWGKKEEGEIILADKEITGKMHRYKKITALQSRLKAIKEAAKNEIALALREGTELRGTDIAAIYTKSNTLKIKETSNDQHAA